MNKRFKKSVLITVIILISSIFINCDNTTTIKNKFKILVLKNNLKKTVKEKKNVRKPIVCITDCNKWNETFYNKSRVYFKG